MRLLIHLVLLVIAVGAVEAQVVDSVFYGDDPALHENPYGWGFIAGTNGYGDIGKYQRFEYYGDKYITAARVYFGYADVVNTPDTVWVVVRDMAADGSPGATLASAWTTLDQVNTSGEGNVITFAQPAKFEGGDFMADTLFVGIEWSPSIDDTLALLADSAGQGDQAQRAWEQIGDGINPYYMWPWWNSADPNFEWGLDADLWIRIYLSATATSVADADVQPGNFLLEPAYPNPFNPSTSIRFTLPEASEVALSVYSMLGQEVARLATGSQSAGTHQVQWHAEGMATGMYFVILRAVSGAGVSTATQKVVLTR